MSVMIGVDPHKGSHTAVAVDGTEGPVGEVRVRSGPAQVDRLLGWAAVFWSARSVRVSEHLCRSGGLALEPPARSVAVVESEADLAGGCVSLRFVGLQP